jgi:hypothetical protein
MDLSHVKLGLDRAGWSRQQNLKVMPAAEQFAGVDMVSWGDHDVGEILTMSRDLKLAATVNYIVSYCILRYMIVVYMVNIRFRAYLR